MSQALCWGLNLLQCPKTQQGAPTFEKKWMLQRKKTHAPGNLFNAQHNHSRKQLFSVHRHSLDVSHWVPVSSRPVSSRSEISAQVNYLGVSLNGGIISGGKTMVVGETHHFRKPPFVKLSYLQQWSRVAAKPSFDLLISNGKQIIDHTRLIQMTGNAWRICVGITIPWAPSGGSTSSTITNLTITNLTLLSYRKHP